MIGRHSIPRLLVEALRRVSGGMDGGMLPAKIGSICRFIHVKSRSKHVVTRDSGYWLGRISRFARRHLLVTVIQLWLKRERATVSSRLDRRLWRGSSAETRPVPARTPGRRDVLPFSLYWPYSGTARIRERTTPGVRNARGRHGHSRPKEHRDTDWDILRRVKIIRSFDNRLGSRLLSLVKNQRSRVPPVYHGFIADCIKQKASARKIRVFGAI